MELSKANKAALMLRFASVFPGATFPNRWEDLSFSQQLQWLQVDEEAARIMRGDVSAATEAALMTETLSPEAPAAVDPRVAYEKRMQEELDRMNQATADWRQQREAREAMAARSLDSGARL